MKRSLSEMQNSTGVSYDETLELHINTIAAYAQIAAEDKENIIAQQQLLSTILNVSMLYIREMNLDAIKPHLAKYLEQYPQLKTILSVMCIGMTNPKILLDDCAIGNNGEEVEKNILQGNWTNALYYIEQAKSLCENNIYVQSLRHIVPVLQDPEFHPAQCIVYTKSMIDSYNHWLNNAPHSALALSYVGAKFANLMNPSSLQFFEYVASLSNMELLDDDRVSEQSSKNVDYALYRKDIVCLAQEGADNSSCITATTNAYVFHSDTLDAAHKHLLDHPNVTKATVNFQCQPFIELEGDNGDIDKIALNFLRKICYILVNTNVMRAKFIIPQEYLTQSITTSLNNQIAQIPLINQICISIGSSYAPTPWLQTLKCNLVTKAFMEFATNKSLWPCAELNSVYNFSILEHAIAKYSIYFGSRMILAIDSKMTDMHTWYQKCITEGVMLTISTFLPKCFPLEVSLHVSTFLNQDGTKELISSFIEFYSKNPMILKGLKEHGSQYTLL